MTTSRIYTCILDEAMQEVEVNEYGKPINPDELTFSVYKTPSGKEIAICSECKSIIVEVVKEVFNDMSKKKGK